MPIQSENIQFRASQVMDDVPEGGGRATATVIRDGASNEIFPDISEADRAGGRVRLRKLFLSVDTPDTDQLLGANIVVAKPPADPNVSVSLFSTGDYFDRRSDAANRVEAYLFAGPEWSGYLLENHIAGQRSIQIFQRPGTELPPIGRTLCLVQDEGAPTEKRQYVRVINVSSVEQTFSYNAGSVIDYPALVVTAELSDALRQDLTGSPPNRLYTRATNGTKIRDTTVADAARYYGAAKLTAAANIGDLSARLDSVFTRLVPSAQTEVPLVDLPMAGERIPMMPAAAAATSYSIAGALAPNGRFVLRSGCFPGSLSLSLGGYTLTDDGAGVVRSGSTEVGTINYATGEIALGATAPTASGTANVSYRPAAPAAQQAHTKQVAVTAENRSYVWVVPLAPLPAPGSVEFSYMAQGRWYTLRDNGAGQLTGSESSYGSGTVSYVTGTLNITVGALPDAGTAVLMSWASPAHYAIRAGATADAAAALRIDYTLAQSPVVPGTLAIGYPVGGTMRTATDAAADGTISGTGVSGKINYATGEVRLEFTAPPDRAASVSNAYTWRDGAGLMSGTTATISGGQFTVPGTAPFRNGGSMTFTLSGAAVQLTAPAYITAGGQVRVYAAGDRHGSSQSEYAWVDQAIGTFDSATGVVTITGPIGATRREYTSGITSAWGLSSLSMSITGVSDIAVERDTAAFDPQAVTDEIVAPGAAGLTLDLTTTVADAVVAGSLVLSVAGSIYIDRAGTLYANPDSATGAAIAAGSIDYTTGRATLTYWADNAAAAVAVLACLTRYGQWTALDATFRAASAPLRPASLYVAATSADGDALTGTSDGDGVIAGTGISGTVNYEYGIVTLTFAEPVDPATIRYNAVAYSYLPLDATLLGLDPVRLPSDGRVPVFRPGEFAVFGRDIPLAPQTVTAAQVIDVGVERLSRVRIVGIDGLGIGTGWSVDLDAGLVTIDDPVGWPQPVTITGRVEDMVRVSDVQISGDITFTRPLTHQFPAGSTVSSALMLGDQRARVSHLFDQQTWDATWSDSLTGSAATASYNDAQYPPEVTNAGAITERWVIRWTNTTSIEVIGEHVGVIYAGPTSTDVAPNNPAAGVPYFTLRALGFGSGWGAGNVIRMNTVGAQPPIWAVLTVQQGATTAIDDAWELLARGDVDRP